MHQSVKKVRRDRNPNENKHPNPAGKQIVIVKETTPGVTGNKVPEDKFESNRQGQPNQSNGKSLQRRIGRPASDDNPDVKTEQDDAGQAGDLVGRQFIEVFTVPRLAKNSVNYSDQYHRYPGQYILQHGNARQKHLEF